jgi:hypothetical protein
MKTYTFIVYFVRATQEIVTATCPTDAVILACAARIKKGQHRECYQVENRDLKELHGLPRSKTVVVNYIK